MKGPRFLFVLCLLLAACSMPASKYVDVSTEQRFRGLVPSSRVTTSDLLLLGVDAYPSEKKIKSFHLVPSPGFGGPEVLSRSVLPAGATLDIVGAQVCVNCLDKSERLVVKLRDRSGETPIYLDAEFARLLVVKTDPPNHYRDESAIYAKYGCGEAVVSPAHVSIEALIENPSAFEGKAVVVDGYYFAKFEHSAIYPHPDDGRNERTEKGLWVLGEVSERDSGKRISVEGIFTGKMRGHASLWPATLCRASVVRR